MELLASALSELEEVDASGELRETVTGRAEDAGDGMSSVVKEPRRLRLLSGHKTDRAAMSAAGQGGLGGGAAAEVATVVVVAAADWEKAGEAEPAGIGGGGGPLIEWHRGVVWVRVRACLPWTSIGVAALVSSFCCVLR